MEWRARQHEYVMVEEQTEEILSRGGSGVYTRVTTKTPGSGAPLRYPVLHLLELLRLRYCNAEGR